MSDIYRAHPRPWSRGASTSDGEPIYDARGGLVMVVQSVDVAVSSEDLQKCIVAAVNSEQNT